MLEKGHIIFIFLLIGTTFVSSFNAVMMGTRRGGGYIKRDLDDDDYSDKNSSAKNINKLNQGRGQEITGVTLPADGE